MVQNNARTHSIFDVYMTFVLGIYGTLIKVNKLFHVVPNKKKESFKSGEWLGHKTELFLPIQRYTIVQIPHITLCCQVNF
jgi:hypothetical protein